MTDKIHEVRLRFDSKRRAQVDSVVAEMGLRGPTELFKRVWDAVYPELQGPGSRITIEALRAVSEAVRQGEE